MTDDQSSIDVMNTTAQSQLKSIVERLERLTEDKAVIGDDIKEVFAEAAGNGFDKAAIRAVLKYRAEDKAKRQEMEAIVDLYLSAVGD